MFRTVAPERGLHTAAIFFASAYQRGLITCADADLAGRLFIGPLLTYVLPDGLLAPDGPRPPAPERIAAHVDLFLRAVC